MEQLTKTSMSGLGGAAIGGALGIGAVMAANPSIPLSIGPEVEGFLSPEKKKAMAMPPLSSIAPDHMSKGQKVVDRLLKAGFNPKKHSLAIAAAGGTGKSTLAAIIGDRLKMKVIQERGEHGSGRKLGVNLDTGELEVKPGHIYEQSYLLSLTNPDRFNAVMHLSRPTAKILRDLKKRKRAAIQADFTHFPEIKKAISYAYGTLGGENIKASPKGSYSKVEFKMRPDDGFGSKQRLDEAVRKAGHDPSGMDREQKLYIAVNKKKPLLASLTTKGMRQMFPNLLRYDVDYPRIARSLGVVGAGIGAGAMLGSR